MDATRGNKGAAESFRTVHFLPHSTGRERRELLLPWDGCCTFPLSFSLFRRPGAAAFAVASAGPGPRSIILSETARLEGTLPRFLSAH
jgi:hypothetical protein